MAGLGEMLDDPNRHLLVIRIRDCERRVLNAKDHYERQAAQVAYEEALTQYELMRRSQTRG